MIHQTDSEPPQPVAEAESLVGVASTDLFSVFDACLNLRPHLLLEIGYNRVVDWMVHIYDGTGLGIKNAELIISTQSPDREEAMSEAIAQLRGRFLPELVTGSGTESGVSPNIVLVEISSENDRVVAPARTRSDSTRDVIAGCHARLVLLLCLFR